MKRWLTGGAIALACLSWGGATTADTFGRSFFALGLHSLTPLGTLVGASVAVPAGACEVTALPFDQTNDDEPRPFPRGRGEPGAGPAAREIGRHDGTEGAGRQQATGLS